MTLPRPFRSLGRALGALSLATLPALPVAAAVTLPFTLGAAAAHAQEDGPADGIGELLDQAMTQLQERDFDGALGTYASVIRRVEALDLTDEQKGQVLSLAHYNSACALSLQGKKGPAIDRFEKALEWGFLDWDHISKDSDLDAIRGEKRFLEVVAKFKGAPRADKQGAKDKAAGLEVLKAEFLKNLSSKPLFDFAYEGKDVDGARLSLGDHKGKVVLVDIWGTWCPPCRAEVPHLADLHRKLGPKGFAVMGLAWERVPPAEAPATVRKFLRDNDVPYPSAVVEKEFPGKAVPDFEGFPTMLLVDRAGKVRMKIVGYTDVALLEAAVERLLSEPAPGAAYTDPHRMPDMPQAPEAPAHGHGDHGHGEKGHDAPKNGRREF